jgi:hypothetical protein
MGIFNSEKRKIKKLIKESEPISGLELKEENIKDVPLEDFFAIPGKPFYLKSEESFFKAFHTYWFRFKANSNYSFYSPSFQDSDLRKEVEDLRNHYIKAIDWAKNVNSNVISLKEDINAQIAEKNAVIGQIIGDLQVKINTINTEISNFRVEQEEFFKTIKENLDLKIAELQKVNK